MATKQEFVSDSFVYNAVNAAVQHNSLYGHAPAKVRLCVRSDIRAAVKELLAPYLKSSSLDPTSKKQYRDGWSAEEGAFLSAVEELCARVNRAFEHHGASGHCRVSHAQKALAVALKYFWCAGLTKNSPPFCPIDRSVLRAAGIRESWTELDNMRDYISWLKTLTSRAKEAEYASLAEWELIEWS